jgi:hypothetical protein
VGSNPTILAKILGKIMKNRMPFATRPLKTLFQSISPLLENDEYIFLTKDQFISKVMKNSGGSCDPKKIESIYNSLMADAGLEPLYENHK